MLDNTMIVTVTVRISAVVDPESRGCVADDTTELAELLKGVLDAVLLVVWDDEEEFPP